MASSTTATATSSNYSYVNGDDSTPEQLDAVLRHVARCGVLPPKVAWSRVSFALSHRHARNVAAVNILFPTVNGSHVTTQQSELLHTVAVAQDATLGILPSSPVLGNRSPSFLVHHGRNVRASLPAAVQHPTVAASSSIGTDNRMDTDQPQLVTNENGEKITESKKSNVDLQTVINDLDKRLAQFHDSPPFTLQRICEIVMNPGVYSWDINRYATALNKVLCVAPVSAIPLVASKTYGVDECFTPIKPIRSSMPRMGNSETNNEDAMDDNNGNDYDDDDSDENSDFDTSDADLLSLASIGDRSGSNTGFHSESRILLTEVEQQNLIVENQDLNGKQQLSESSLARIVNLQNNSNNNLNDGSYVDGVSIHFGEDSGIKNVNELVVGGPPVLLDAVDTGLTPNQSLEGIRSESPQLVSLQRSPPRSPNVAEIRAQLATHTTKGSENDS